MILYLSLGLCALGSAVLVYRYDLYDREPKTALAVAVGLGALAMALAGPAETAVFGLFHRPGPVVLAAVASVAEEALKLLVVGLMALLARRVFNDPMDGIIYGSMAGLGAALEEGVAGLRAAGLQETWAWLPPEELVRLCGHLVFGGVGGFGVGRTRLRQPGWPWSLALGFAAAVALHFGWDLIALRRESLVAGANREAFFAAGLMLAGFVLYGRLVIVASSWSQRLFSPGVVRRLGGG